MSDDDYDQLLNYDTDDDTFSMYEAFDMDEYNLRGLRIYMGRRRALSIDFDGPPPYALNSASECRNEWAEVSVDDSADVDKFNKEQRAVLGFERGFVDPDGPVAEQMGQAIDLALRMMETQKSINIMTGVAQRLVHNCPEVIHHITPESTWDQIQTSVRGWMGKLRQDEFFKIQVIDGEFNSAVVHRTWARFVSGDVELATLADYRPHYAGMLQIDVKIVKKLIHHAASSHPLSHIERQKCLFHLANLIVNQVQRFWVGFLVDGLSDPRAEEPPAVYNETTEGLFEVYNSVNAGYHWDAEFFGGVVHMWHNIHNPSTDFNQHGGFGRVLSIGDAYLNRPDGSEQLVLIDSIIRCTAHDFSDVCHGGLRVVGPRVPSLGFPFIDYDTEY